MRRLTPDEAHEMSAARKTHGGRRGVTMACAWCGKPQTARSIREHFTTCPKRPKLPKESSAM